MFPDAERKVMCYVHVLRNIQKHFNKLNDRNNRAAITNDITVLHHSESEIVFDTACDLFCKKWKKTEPIFIKYFKSTWLGTQKYWFGGATTYAPSHNNALEGFNGVLKRDFFFRERLPFGEFSVKIMEITNAISTQYSEGIRQFKKEPEIKEVLWRTGNFFND